MNKSKSEALARRERAKAAVAKPKADVIAPDAREAAQERETRGAVNLTAETIDAIVGGVSREIRRALLEIGPMLARIAAADTIRTVEKPARVLGRAIDEGRMAQALLEEMGGKA